MERELDRAQWRRSTYSGSGGGNCVEIAAAPDMILTRDSKDPSGPVLAFSTRTWERFASTVKQA